MIDINISREKEIYFKDLDNDIRKSLMREELIGDLSNALTYYLFKDGNIGQVARKLSDKDIDQINETISNKIAGLLLNVRHDNWLNIDLLFKHNIGNCAKWELPEPDTKEMDKLFLDLLRFFIKQPWDDDDNDWDDDELKIS